MLSMEKVDIALEALSEVSPRDYLRREDGRTLLLTLHSRCVDSGLLVARDSIDDVSRLHDIFSVAVSHGMGNLVLDYINEVCADDSLSSADPVESFMLDGECVRVWLSKGLGLSIGRLLEAFGDGFATPSSQGVFERESCYLRALALISGALSPNDDSRVARSKQKSGEREMATRGLQCALVMRWATRALEDRSVQILGRFRSEQEWRAMAIRKRERGGADGSFLTTLISRLRDEHEVDPLPYPPPTPERLLRPLFLSGHTSDAARLDRLGLLLYYIADMGIDSARRLARDIGLEFDLPLAQVLPYAFGYLVDARVFSADIDTDTTIAELEALMGEIDGALVPLALVDALADHGHAQLALLLVRQRPKGGELAEARLALKASLQCGHLAEGVLQLNRHLRRAAKSERSVHARSLINDLLEWAHREHLLNAIIRLSFSGFAEEALLLWFTEKGTHDTAVALLLTMYYLIRGRTAEALVAHHLYSREAAEFAKECAEVENMLRIAVRGLPAPLRDLAVVVDPTASPNLTSISETLPTGAVIIGRLGLENSVTAVTPSLLAIGPSLLEVPLIGDPIALESLLEERAQATKGSDITNAPCKRRTPNINGAATYEQVARLHHA